jgi:NIMA (never in mitosis gene a)-related kinase
MDQSDFIRVEESNPDMLQTIKIPKNLQFLNDKLPKPNYNPVRII